MAGSSSSSRRWRSFTGFLLTIGLLGLAAVAVKSVSRLPSLTNQSTDSPLTTATPSLIIAGGSATPTSSSSPTVQPKLEVIVLDTSKGVNRLVSLDPITKARKILFTDADEKIKIKQVGNLASHGQEALVLMGNPNEDFGGALYMIDISGGGTKHLLIDQFASPWPPVFSPDGKKIAYVFFSNAELEAGFFLVIANRDGSNKRELVHETTAITQPVFAPSGSEIAYVRGASRGGKNTILAVKTTGGTPRQIATFTDRVPYDLAWAADDSTAFVDGTGDAANLFELTKGATQSTKLTTPAGAQARPTYSPDAKLMAFTTTAGASSSIIILDRLTGKIENIGSGSVVLGWREKK